MTLPLRASRLAVILLMLAACSEPPATAPGPVEGPLPWGGTPNVHRYGELALAGQPDAAGLAAAHAAGMRAVVNLREPGESSWDEAGAAEAAGLAYYTVPVSGREPLSREAMDRIDAIVAEHDGVLVHCASGNRAAAWLGVHLVRRQGMALDDALGIARQAGLRHERYADAVREQLAR